MNEQKLQEALHMLRINTERAMAGVKITVGEARHVADLINSAFPPSTPPATTGLKWGAEVYLAAGQDRAQYWRVCCVKNTLFYLVSGEWRVGGRLALDEGTWPSREAALKALASAPPPPGSSPQEGEGCEVVESPYRPGWVVRRGTHPEHYEFYHPGFYSKPWHDTTYTIAEQDVAEAIAAALRAREIKMEKHMDHVAAAAERVANALPDEITKLREWALYSGWAHIKAAALREIAAVLRSNGKETGACGGSLREWSSGSPSPQPSPSASSPTPPTEAAPGSDPSPATAEDEDILAALRDRRTIYRVTDGHSFNTDARDQLERLHAAALSEIERLRNARCRTTARYRMCCSKCSASVPVVAMLVSGEGPRSVLCNGEGEWIMADPSRTIPADVRRHDGES